LTRYKVVVELEADDKDDASRRFVQLIEQYLGDVISEPPFDIIEAKTVKRMQ
jgi:hypothetical protein